nr:MAG TPA: hypothetical protein [Bacteriophage sp.]
MFHLMINIKIIIILTYFYNLLYIVHIILNM